MIVDLRELEDGDSEFSFEESPAELHIEDPEIPFSGPIETRITFHKLGVSLSVNGTTEANLKPECARCLEKFDLRLGVEFSFLFQKEKPSRMEGDEDETLIWLDSEAEQIDLGSEIKDYILLELPINPVCEESCAGLCPTCGSNLNTESCDCTSETIDPRWEALRALKE